MYVLNQEVANSTQVKRLRTLVSQQVADEPAAMFLALFTRIDKLREERNVYVHGLWKPGPELSTAMVHTVRLGREIPANDALVTLADLNELSAEIENVAQGLYTAALKYGVFRIRP